MQVHKLAAVALAAALAAPIAAHGQAAQPAPTQRAIGFDEAVKIALSRNVQLRQARNATALGAASVRQQQLDFLPDLRFSTSGSNSLGRNFSEGEGRVVDATTQSLSAGLSSSVTVFDGLRNVAELRGAKLEESATERDLTRTRQTVAFTVASNYLALGNAGELLRVQRENLSALEAQEATISQLVKAGTRPISDLYQQQAAVASARAAVVEAERTLELAKVDLIQTLQLDPAGSWEFAAPSLAERGASARSFDLDSLLAGAFANRVDLDAEQARVAAAGQDVKAASAGRLPTVSLSGGYNTGFTTANDLTFADQLDQRRGGSLSIGVSIPLWDRGSTGLAEQRARIQADNARLSLDARRQEVALEVRRAYLDHQAAQLRLTAADAQRAAAEQAVNASEQRYRVGASTLLEVTQARAGLVQASSALVNARSTLAFQQALMSYYTGDLDPAGITLAG